MLYCAHAGRLTTVHVPGVDNIMADIASRPSKAQKLFRAESPLSDLDFCSSFDTTFPLPDNQSWSLAIVPQWLRFNVFETLRGKRLDLLQWMGPNANATGKHGKRTAGSTATTPTTYLRKGLSQTAVTVREGKYGLGNQVKVQSVAKALRLVSQKLVLDGHPDPRRASPAQHALDLPISRLLKKYNDEDPPAEPKLAIPISTITSIAKNYRWTSHLSAVANLAIIAFFYLLRVGEYTSPATPREKRTIPLRKCDVRLWRKGQVLSHSAGLEALLRADSATICIANTKMAQKAQWFITKHSEV
jgi:hypothetical protein